MCLSYFLNYGKLQIMFVVLSHGTYVNLCKCNTSYWACFVYRGTLFPSTQFNIGSNGMAYTVVQFTENQARYWKWNEGWIFCTYKPAMVNTQQFSLVLYFNLQRNTKRAIPCCCLQDVMSLWVMQFPAKQWQVGLKAWTQKDTLSPGDLLWEFHHLLGWLC